LPNDFASIELVSINQNDYKKYTVSTATGESLYDGSGNEMQTSAKVLVFSAEGGEEDGFL
jgi:hypothetical protein